MHEAVYFVVRSAFFVRLGSCALKAMLGRAGLAAGDLLVRQKTQTINVLRGHLAEFGIVAAQGPARVEALAKTIEDETSLLPTMARDLDRLLLGQIAEQGEKIGVLEKEISRRAPKDEKIARLMTIPGLSAICATAVHAFAPSMSTFGSGRDFAAWVGLTPREHPTGGKAWLGRTSKMRQRGHCHVWMAPVWQCAF